MLVALALGEKGGERRSLLYGPDTGKLIFKYLSLAGQTLDLKFINLRTFLQLGSQAPGVYVDEQAVSQRYQHSIHDIELQGMQGPSKCMDA